MKIIINGVVYTIYGKTTLFYGKTTLFVFFYIFIYMGSHIVAKEKIKGLTARLEKSLYKLKYGDREITEMDEAFYNKVKCICESNNYPFPLIKRCGEIIVECNTTQVFCTLSKLADDYGIIIDTKKTTT